jgi:hypothetical protein
MKSPGEPELIYSIQRIVLLAGCSSAEPVSSSDTHLKVKNMAALCNNHF